MCHRKQKIEERKLCVRPTVRFDFSARKDNTILNTAHVYMTDSCQEDLKAGFMRLIRKDQLKPLLSCGAWV